MKFKLNRKIEFLLQLININGVVCDSDIERYFNYHSPQPDLRELLKYLRKHNIIVEKEKKLGINFYTIDKEELIKHIRNSPFFISFGNFIEKTVHLYNY